MDWQAISAALAARYAPAAVTPPAGLEQIRSSTADLPQEITALPAVLVFPDSGAFDTGDGTRAGLHRFLVQFYLTQTVDLSRETNRCQKWLGVLADQLRTGGAVQLGGLVDNCELATWRIALITYAGMTHAGIELGVNVTTSEGWNPS